MSKAKFEVPNIAMGQIQINGSVIDDYCGSQGKMDAGDEDESSSDEEDGAVETEFAEARMKWICAKCFTFV